MATIGNSDLTLADWAKRSDPDGKVDGIVEQLTETNEILEDAVWLEGNLPTGHRTTIRSGLPAVTWRYLNYGVQPSKSTTKQVTDAAGMLEAYSEVDKALADLNGNTAEFRASEDMAFLEAMNQELADTIFYGNTNTDPEKFMGLAPRFNSLSAGNGGNIINGGGSGSDNHSIWLVVWGARTCHMFFPKGKMTGLMHEDLGQHTLEDAAGGKYEGYRTWFKWEAGMTVRDWRYVVRIANIDNSDLTKDASAGADLIDLMTQSLETVQDLNSGRPAFYANRTVKSFLRRQLSNKNNVNLTLDNAMGKHVLRFDGIPVRLCEGLNDGTEATIS